jgi:diguanylate cyclase (GGDEF)-like protein/PAS domain S-box-containing protein
MKPSGPQKLRALLPRWAQSTLATRTSIVTSLLFLIAILAVGAASLVSLRSQLLTVVVEQQDTLVDRIADDLDQKLLALQNVMRQSAGEITVADVASPDAAQRYLESNTGLFASIDRSIFLFTEKGILLAERPFKGRRGGDASWRPYIRDTIRTHEPVISDPFVSNVGDANMVVVLTMPVFAGDGRMIAILTGSLGLTHPNVLGSIAKTTLGRTGYLYIVTREGKLLMHPDRKRLGQVAFAPGSNAFFERALTGAEGTEEALDPDGRVALVSYQQVPSSKWIVGAARPKDEALQPITDLIRNFVALLLVAILVVVVAIWILTRYTMRPLVSLTRHITSYDATDEIAPLQGEKGSGEIRALTSAFNRLTATLHEREDALVEAMQRYQLITENSTDLITKHEPNGVITFASPVSATVVGVEYRALIGHSLFEFVHPEDFDAVRAAFVEAEESGVVSTLIFRMRHANQRYIWLETTMRLMKGTTGEEMQKILCISRDISERKRMEGRMHELARTDHLTSLPNRFLLDERFAGGVAQSRREGSMLALLMIDIDRFKNINDSLGHGTGDALLRLVGSKLKSCIRECDTLARWGGDEFVLLLPGLQDPATAVTVAQRCLASLKEPFEIEGQSLRVTASIGISVSPDSTEESETLLKNADTAMYRAKAQGGNCYVMYSVEMNAGARSRLSLENALFHAIERDELLLHYQPLISARTGRIAGVEALLRWQHPDHGLIPPGQFIPLAEETGLIVSIGEWVLHTACAQMKRWYGRGLPRIGIAVNLSSRQFRQDDLANTVRGALDATGLDPRLLELELTESVLMDDAARSKAILNELNELGVSVALDDFGTGYSSLSYLKGFQLDALKIDRTFTAEITTSEATAAIVRATIALARGLRLRTVAEGVETRAQAEFLVRHGCDTLQGFLFARPMDPAAFFSFATDPPTYLFSRTPAEEVERIG